MSAEIIKETTTGATATFFRLWHIAIDRDPISPKITARVAAYVSKEAFEAGKDYLFLRDYFREGEHLAPLVNSLEGNPMTVDQLFALFYSDTVGTDPYFAGAVKV